MGGFANNTEDSEEKDSGVGGFVNSTEEKKDTSSRVEEGVYLWLVVRIQY